MFVSLLAMHAKLPLTTSSANTGPFVHLLLLAFMGALGHFAGMAMQPPEEAVQATCLGQLHAWEMPAIIVGEGPFLELNVPSGSSLA